MYPERVKRGDVVGRTSLTDKMAGAYNLAVTLHGEQLRRSGEPFFYHEVEVMRILREEFGIEIDSMLVAGILHDAVEDTEITSEEIKNIFGEETANIVVGVTKIKGRTDHETTQQVVRLTPKVGIVKLADRLHNMRTLQFMPREKQIEKAMETMRVYTVLAESLGMWVVKRELEDLSFKYLDPEGCEETKNQVDKDLRLGDLFLAHTVSEMNLLLQASGIEGKIDYRIAGYWEIKKKQRKLALSGGGSMDNFFEIDDLVSIRVIIKNKNELFKTLGVIHGHFGDKAEGGGKILLGAKKTDSGYEAIQTSVAYREGPVELAIVTDDMELLNNWGKVGMMKMGIEDLGDIGVVRVFDKDKKLHFLPTGATAFDFAASISPHLLAKAVMAKIDGELLALSTVLPEAGDVEIVLEESRRYPIEGAEQYCLPRTRKTVDGLRLMEKRDRMIAKGRDVMRDILTPRGLLDITDIGSLTGVLDYFALSGFDDLYISLANGSRSKEDINQILDKMGITKKKMRLCTLELTGADHPGILLEVTEQISNAGKNIIHTFTDISDGVFYIRMVVEGYTNRQLLKLGKLLTKNNSFNNCVVV